MALNYIYTESFGWELEYHLVESLLLRLGTWAVEVV